MPQADSTEAVVGTMMRDSSSSRATSAACRPGRAAEAEQRKAAGIDAAPQRHQADAVGHLQIDQAIDAGGGLDRA